MNNINEQQYRAALQTTQERYISLELLNNQFQTVDNLSGVAIGGNLTIDANSDIRRTANVTLAIQNSSFNIQPAGKIWLDKYIRVWVGVRSILTGEIEWTNCGVYIIDAPSYKYDLKTNTLSLTLLDLMAKLTGARNGYLKGVPTVIKAGENIRKAIIDTLALGGFTKYVVEEAPSPGVVPNDLEFGQGSTVYNVLSGLKEIYPGYEMFFDVNGTFFYRKIPSGQGDPVLVNDNVWNNIVLSEDSNTDFQSVKNSIEVYGRIHDPAYFASSATVVGKDLYLASTDVKDYVEDAIYGFKIKVTTAKTLSTIKINDLSSYPVKADNGKPVVLKPEGTEVMYCVQYKKGEWRWLGHLQAYGFAEDTNPESPFYVEGTVGRIRLPLHDGEYANCITDDLAQQRAEYELWKATNMNNSITLSIIPVPWLDVNILVEYTIKHSNNRSLYIIKNINYGLGVQDAGSVNMIKFYPEK